MGIAVLAVLGIGTATVTAAKRPKNASQQSTNMVKKVTAGDLTVKALAKPTIITQGKSTKLLRLKVSVKNTGQQEVILSGVSFQLKSASHSYYAQNAGTIHFNEKHHQHALFFETLHRQATLKGTIIFKIPSSVVTDPHTKLVVTNSPFGKKATSINLH